MSIQEHLNKIRNAIKGSEVRESIAKGIETAYDDASEKDNANMEVKIARGTHPNLRSRLEEVDDKQQQTTAQLAQIDSEKVDKNGEGQISYVNLDQQTKEKIANVEEHGFPVTEPQSVGKAHIIHNSVTTQATDFINVTSSNLFNKNNMLDNSTVTETGEVASHSVLGVSKELRQILPNTNYTTKNILYIAMFDNTLNFIGLWRSDQSNFGQPQIFNPNENRFIREIVHMELYDSAQMNLGVNLLEYEPYKEEISKSLIGDKSLETTKYALGSVTPEVTSFIELSTNLFNKNNMDNLQTITPGGQKESHQYVGTSKDFVRVEPYSKYSSSRIIYIAKFDELLNFKGRWSADQNNLYGHEIFETGSASFVKFIVNNELYDTAQFNKGNDLQPYEPYSETLKLHGYQNNIDGDYLDTPIENYGQFEMYKDTHGNTETLIRDYNKYPNRLVWGHEYMYSWYDKLMNDETVKMVWAGDSTTAGEGEFKRHSLGKKILTRGGYPTDKVISINAGHGYRHTGDWLGGDYIGDSYDDGTIPNYLDEDMQENPDLYILGYGFNDGSAIHYPNLSIQERVDRFEHNLNLGLERIRGSMYNKSADDMAIILTTPISGYSVERENLPQDWNDRIRPIIQKACRDYHCAFVDITARGYDHGFSGSWSTANDFVHPLDTKNADIMSLFPDLLFPYLMHKV